LKKVLVYTTVALGTIVGGFALNLLSPPSVEGFASNKPFDRFEALAKIEIGVEGHGSGVFVSPDVVYTVRHVADTDAELKVIDSTGGIHHVIGKSLSSENDFAILMLDKRTTVKPAKAVCEYVEPLDRVYIVGYPMFFEAMVFENIVAGYVYDDPDGVNFTATGVALPGDSGGPVYNSDDEVVGVLHGEYINPYSGEPVETDLNIIIPFTAIPEICGEEIV
jgi:S1-C subfamily serine protease